MISRLLVAILAVTACKKESPPPPPPPTAGESKGFQPTRFPLPPPEAAELEKLARMRPSPRPSAAPIGPRAALLDEQGKPLLAVFVDGVLRAKIAVGDLATPLPLDRAAARGGEKAPRLVLAHSDDGELWLKGGELAKYQLRLNRREQIKLEPASQERGDGDSKERPAGPHHQSELRAVTWIEVRSARSPHLLNEPE
jgi:hypothetical protein